MLKRPIMQPRIEQLIAKAVESLKKREVKKIGYDGTASLE